MQSVKQQVSLQTEDDGHGGVAHERKATWTTVGILQVTDIVGTGILGLGGAVALLGWVPSAICLVAFLAINIYAGIILQKVYLVVESAGLPEADSLPTMARSAIKHAWFTVLTKVLYYAFLITVLAQYMQVLSISLRHLFLNWPLCAYTFSIFALLILLPLSQVRTLNDSRGIQILSMGTISLVVLFSVGFMLQNMPEDTPKTVLVNTSASWQDIFSALATLTFAFAGSPVYPEMMSEMVNVRDFHKSFYISAPYQLAFYALAAFSQYAFEGEDASGQIYMAIPVNNPLYGAAAFLLAVHVACAYILKGTIMTRILHVALFRETVNDRGIKGSLHWLLCTVLVATVAFLISNAIPSFDVLMDLIGSVLVSTLGFVWPPLLLWFSFKLKGPDFRPRHAETAAVICMFLFGVAITVLGTASASQDLAQEAANGNAPFHC